MPSGNSMKGKVRAEAKARARLSPQSIARIKLLTMPLSELESFVIDEVTANPVMELPEDFAGAEHYDAAVETGASHPLDMVGEQCSWQDTLQGALALEVASSGLPRQTKELALRILDYVDDDGYLRFDDAELTRLLGVAVDEVREAVSFLQRCEPRGMCARDLAECLALQVDRGSEDGELLARMIADDFDALVGRQVSKLKKHYHLGQERVNRIIAQFRELNPRPGSSLNGGDVLPYDIADIIVTSERGLLTLKIADDDFTRISIDEEYLEQMGGLCTNDEERSYLEEKVEEAKQLISNLDNRHRTLEAFAIKLIEHQRGFFLQGRSKLSPLKMQTLADELGVSLSTVSRIVHGKMIATPWGVLPLKRFFSVAHESAYGKEPVSTQQIKEFMKRLVENEDPGKPLSDGTIASFVAGKTGAKVARRTIAKYRMELGIPECRQRKRIAV